MIPTSSGDVPDIGVSLATAISNRQVAAALYNAENSNELLDALDAYTNELKVLPGDFDTERNKIDPPRAVQQKKMVDDEMEEIDEDRR